MVIQLILEFFFLFFFIGSFFYCKPKIIITNSYKALENHNPIITQKFTADPAMMIYNDRIYIYGSNDGQINILGNKPKRNNYNNLKSVNVMSSNDLVNWIDHGTIKIAGKGGICKWTRLSWAPYVTHKTINGEEKFFLYFGNGHDGIGVLTGDTPTGPFIDPIGKPLINKKTKNCKNITKIFDPSVLVDDDGNSFLYFGGGVPKGKDEFPKTVRVVKLGSDMISLDGDPILIDAPWAFEDSEINKFGNTYYYSYCNNIFNCSYGKGRIAYMTSNNPMGPFTYQGTIFNNPKDFFGTFGNNHHTIVEYKNKWYIFYHARWLNKQIYKNNKGYRTTHLDEIPFIKGKFGNATGTLKGVNQIIDVNAFEEHPASMMAWQGGISINGLGYTTATYKKGDWTGISNVSFNNGARYIKIFASSQKGANIKVTIDSPQGKKISKIHVPDDNIFNYIKAPVKRVSGTHNLFFIADNTVKIDTWQFFNSSI